MVYNAFYSNTLLEMKIENASIGIENREIFLTVTFYQKTQLYLNLHIISAVENGCFTSQIRNTCI